MQIDFIKVVKYYFSDSKFYPLLNSTIISQIPKVPNLSTMKEYRPISCCNTVYKVFSKILTKRIKKVLPKLICNRQNAFLKGRVISDNILLMHAIVNGYHRNTGQVKCAMKIDLVKAHDTVRWDFLFTIMECMNFPKKFICWVKK